MINYIKKQLKGFYSTLIIYSLLFFILAVLLYLYEYNNTNSNSNFFLLTTYQYGHELFLLMIGSLLTLITMSISLMMVVLTVYGAQFSPRTLQDFLANKKTLHILGFLIGILVYSITSFFLLNNLSTETKLVSSPIGTLLFIASVFVFVYFIRFVSRSVQINLYIQELGKEILSEISAKEASVLSDPYVHFKKEVNLLDVLGKESIEIKSVSNGYIQSYDNNKIVELATISDCIILSKKQIGEYIFIDDILFEIFKVKKLNEDFSKNLIRYVEIGDEANLNNSLGFGTKKLTEIALRALPPTATDPATACFCIDQLGEALKGITTILAQVVYSDEQNNVRHIAQKEYFSRILFDHFAQIKLYGFNDVAIIKSTLTAFIKIAEKAESNQNKELWEFTMFMLENTSFLELHKYNYELLISDLYKIAELTENTESFVTLYKK